MEAAEPCIYEQMQIQVTWLNVFLLEKGDSQGYTTAVSLNANGRERSWSGVIEGWCLRAVAMTHQRFKENAYVLT